MRSWIGISIVTAAALTAGCATSQEWSEWKNHPTHRDLAWWGNPITVSQDQIVEY